MESRIKFKIGEIEFEAEGTADIVERERKAFMQVLLPAAIDAIVKTRTDKYVDSCVEMMDEKEIPLIAKDGSDVTDIIVSKGSIQTDYSRTNLAGYIKEKGTLTEQEFTLFAAYFDEKKNGKDYFTRDDVEKYYSDARRAKPSNISMSLNRLAEKGLIMDADNVEQKIPKPYIISSEGLQYIEDFQPKMDIEKKHAKSKKNTTKNESVYKSISVDDLNLSKYPDIKVFKEFKSKMMMVLYIIINEAAGEWFTTADVMCLLTDIFGEPATKDQVNGVFNREKLWFKVEKIEGSKRDSKRKVLNAGIEYAKTLISETEV